MSLPEELQALAALKRDGALTEQEFAQAKAEVIAKYGGAVADEPGGGAAELPRTVQLRGGWPHRMGTYELDGYHDGKARYRNKSFQPQTWHEEQIEHCVVATNLKSFRENPLVYTHMEVDVNLAKTFSWWFS